MIEYRPVRGEDGRWWVPQGKSTRWPFESWADANAYATKLHEGASRARKVSAGSVEYRSAQAARVLFRKQRFNWQRRDGEVTHKEFRYSHQPQPPEGVWVARKPECADRTLYRLPELRAALAGGRGSTVFWCEGESDADAVAAELDLDNPPPGPDLDRLRLRLVRRGEGVEEWRRAVDRERRRVARWWKDQQADGWPAAATSHHGGAVHVTEGQAALFRGFRGRVVVVTDLDGPGAADAVVRRGLLVGVAALDPSRVSVVVPRAGKDARDHLRAGKGLPELREARERDLRRAAREYAREQNGRAEARGYLKTSAAMAMVEHFVR